ncbi:MAG TPA: Ig-like domain-containing protein, partial [Longimicrobiales bacterium]
MRRLSAVALLAPVCIVGCGDAPLESVSRRIEAADVAFMVSNPQRDAGATSAAVFASAAVGSLGNAATARITNMSTGAAADVALTDGGFDPIGIAAGIGDTIRLTALTSSNVISMDRRVERERPPRVVRTVPAARKRDVPLNAAVIVVFSEPVDPATLNSSSVRLRRADQAVAASVRFIDGQHLKARLEPAALLEPNTTYELAVSTAIRDLDGDHLEAPVTIEFSTGHTVNAAGAYMDQSHVTLAPGESLQLQVRQQFGYVPIDLIAWSSADPSVATVDHAGVVRGVAPGTTTITATAQGETASAEVYIAALDFVQVDAGGEHTCGLTTQGEAYCWGANWGGLLGSDARGSTTPVRVSGDLRFVSLTVGSYHSCGVVADGTAYCWGGGPALGTGVDERCEPSQPDYVCSRQPRPVAGGVRFTQIS